MKIILRDTDMEEIGSLYTDGLIVCEKRCTNLAVTDTDMDSDGEVICTVDFLENKPLEKISTRELLAELERRVGQEGNLKPNHLSDIKTEN